MRARRNIPSREKSVSRGSWVRRSLAQCRTEMTNPREFCEKQSLGGLERKGTGPDCAALWP